MFDRNGVDGSFPTEIVSRNTRIVRYSGAMNGPSVKVPRGMDAADMEFQIHCIETEAYSAVLRALIAQSDVLSWGKEALISDLRKELRVSDGEHRELLAKVNSDDSVRMIREWRKGTVGEKELLSNTTNLSASVPSSMGPAQRKRFKTFPAPMSISPNYPPPPRPSPAVIPSSIAMHFRDSQWGGEVAIFSNKTNAAESMKPVYDGRHASIVSKGSRQVISQSKEGQPSNINNSEKRADVIKIHVTDELILEVERAISGGASTKQLEVAKAKLKEHERAIVEALDKLGYGSDDDGSPSPGHSQHWLSYGGGCR